MKEQRMSKLMLLLMSVCAMLTMNACTAQVSGNAKDAYAAYLKFTDLIETCSNAPGSCDKDALWNMIDVKTKTEFAKAYTALVNTNTMIETYFDPIEHKQMRQRTGIDILTENNISSYEDLFKFAYKPENFKFNPHIKSGLKFKSDSVTNDGGIMIETQAPGQSFTMYLENDGVWRTSALLPFVQNALRPISVTLSQMNIYTASFLEEEVARRNRVKDYFSSQTSKR